MSILQMSITAGGMVVVIVLIRTVGLKKLPKTTFLLLWGLVLFRLLIPLSISAPWSIYSGISSIGAHISPDEESLSLIEHESFIDAPLWIFNMPNESDRIVPAPQTVSQSAALATSPATVVWLVGVTVMVSLLTGIYWGNFRKLRFTVHIEDNNFLNKWLETHKLYRQISIAQSDMIQTPVAVGLLRPKIILPKRMNWQNEQLVQHVLMHEYFHIKRWDMLWKLLFALALCIHWFNPLVWIMFVLINRDLMRGAVLSIDIKKSRLRILPLLR